MFRDVTPDWTSVAAAPEIDPAEAAGDDDLDRFAADAIETIILRRQTRLHAATDSLILIEIHRDLLGAFVVTRSSASTDRAPRSIAIPCSSWDEAMVEAGSRIHRALSHGYRLCRERRSRSDCNETPIVLSESVSRDGLGVRASR